MTPLVDTHQHLWDLSKLSLPWLDGVTALKDDFKPDRYARESSKFSVGKTVYMEVDVAPDQVGEEAAAVLALCDADDNPMAGVTLRAHPGEPWFEDHVRRFIDDGRVKGFRQVLQPPDLKAGHCLSEDFIKDTWLLGDLGKHYDICVRPAELGDAVKLVDACPDTRFVLDHCGNADLEVVNGSISPEDLPADDIQRHDADQWRRDIEALGQRGNIICKISGVIARLPEGKINHAADALAPTVNHCLDAFGPDRVVFGSDWPVCTLGAPYQTWVEAVTSIISERSEEDQRKLWAKNAEGFYGV